MLPTVGDLLGLDVIRRGSPQVVAGSGGLGARVRWVHVLELANVAACGAAGAGGVPTWFGVAKAGCSLCRNPRQPPRSPQCRGFLVLNTRDRGQPGRDQGPDLAGEVYRGTTRVAAAPIKGTPASLPTPTRPGFLSSPHKIAGRHPHADSPEALGRVRRRRPDRRVRRRGPHCSTES